MGPEVVITGIGPLLPNCDDRDVFWEHLKAGKSQLSTVPDPAEPSRSVPVGRIQNFDPDRYFADMPERHVSWYSRELQIYLASLFVARADSHFDIERVTGERVGIYDGSSRGSVEFWDQRIRQET